MVKKISLSVFIILLIFLQTTGCANDGWQQADEILKSIVPPVFPDKEYLLTDFGGKGDSVTDNTEAFRKAIEECSKNGGGKVIVPEGIFITGAIHLMDNVNLYISEKAVVKFSTDDKKYLPVVFTRWEGVECMNYSPLIYAYGKTNIAVTGKGVLDGQGSKTNWWPWKGKPQHGWIEGIPEQSAAREKLFKMAEDNVPPEERIMGEGSWLRPPFLQTYKCKNVLIEGVTFKDSPFWFIHPVLSENITIQNVTTIGHGPNNDGCDPESSRNILIKDCLFDNGDDCIAIKSGRNADGRRINIPSENIIITGCTMKDGHGGVVIGSEISGGVRNVYAENCGMDSPNLDRVLRIKTNAVRGGTVENIYLRNIEVGQVSEAVIKINFFYEEGREGKYLPVVKNVNIENVNCNKSKYVLWIKAFEESPVKGITIKNSNFKNVAEENIIENAEKPEVSSVTINGREYNP